ncbi:acylphosphatase [Candidatus Pacearchaeota archaeon]|jgi:acylphosphatase|nr:acylphosphatase [Candidatus Pacearchaeota archaeon]
MKTLKLFISGIVQGVFFRKFLKETADELGVKGFVRNLEDGRVEVVVEGRDEKVNEMIDRCKKGPKHSEVKKVESEEMRHVGFDSFKVLSL